MDFLNFNKSQTLFIITNERLILLAELFKYIKNKINENNKLYLILENINLYENNKILNNINHIFIKNSENSDIYEDNNIILYDINKFPDYLSNKTFNIIIYDKLLIPNNIINNINYIICHLYLYDILDRLRPIKKIKLSENKFFQNYKIFKNIVFKNILNNNIYEYI